MDSWLSHLQVIVPWEVTMIPCSFERLVLAQWLTHNAEKGEILCSSHGWLRFIFQYLHTQHKTNPRNRRACTHETNPHIQIRKQNTLQPTPTAHTTLYIRWVYSSYYQILVMDDGNVKLCCIMSTGMCNTHSMNVLLHTMTFEHSVYEKLLVLNLSHKFQFTHIQLYILSILTKDVSIV